jgi:hypothetical protein
LGELIGLNNFNLIYGGANVGLMHECSEAARSNGAHSTGIIPERINALNLSSKHDNELIITPNMRERKYLMRKKSDAFIALPGGFGTLEEILEVITLKQLKYHNKPIVIINSYGFYDSLLQQFETSFSENFAEENYRKLYQISDNANSAIDYLKNLKS